MAPRKRKPERHERRKPGTGAIRYKKGREKPWEAAFPIGHRQYRYDYFTAREEANAHLDRLAEEARDKEQPRNVQGGSQRADLFLEFWLNLKSGHVKPKTLRDYQYQCELAITEIGTLRVDEVTRERADEMLAYFRRRGFKNVGQMRMVLRQAFEYAVDEGYIKRNPFQKAKAAPVTRRKAIALSREQRAALLAVVVGHPQEAIWHLYSRLGLRKGEGLGLRWRDVDLDRRILSVEQQYTDVGGKTVKGTPKTPRSARQVPIPADIVDLLRQTRTRVYERRLKAGPDWQDHDLVFPSERGTPITPRNLTRTFKAALKRAGLSEAITIHDLRHTALTLLELDGIPQSLRMALAGHASAAMAGHYTDHAELEALRAVVERSA